MDGNEKKVDSSVEHVEFSQSELAEHRERLDANRENVAEQNRETQQERQTSARHEVEQATAEKEAKKQESAPSAEHVAAERPMNTKAARKKAYTSIMKQTRSELPLVNRAFSQIIHNPVVEKTSEVVGSTVARPNSILSGAVAAFLLTLVIYVVARANGYPLTGSETIAGFIAGWVIGSLYDLFRVMITGKK